ncbi:cation:proton antiporter [Candidatus Uhrbacteria bacterium]|nr:cation:proton antiporter [Candidatus Uhrbacteria bacterium]
MIDNVFLQTTVLLAIAVAVAFVVRLFRQPLLVAYLVAGVVAGPFLLNLIDHRAATSGAFAEFGVVLLLFVIGLNLNVGHLRSIGVTAVITGVGQLIFTAVIGYLVLLPFSLATIDRVYLAIAITFSSTIIIVKLLTDQRDAETVYGRHTVGLMIVQDIIAIVLLVLLSTVGVGEAVGVTLGLLIGKGILITALAILLARRVFPVLLDRLATSTELLFLFTITWCFAVASLLRWVGFSLEIGAIVAGLSLGSSRYQAEIASRIRPLRDFFLVLFFIILGSQLQLVGIRPVIAIGSALAIFILIGNPVILYALYRFRRFTRRNSFLAGVTAAQVSEFGFVLLFTGDRLGHITPAVLPAFTFTALVTFIVSTYLITYNEELYRRVRPLFSVFGPDRSQQRERVPEPYDVWVIGYHRIGWKVCEMLQKTGTRFAVIDDNPAAIRKLEQRGIPALFGDASDIEFLESLPLARAALIISTIPNPDDQRVLLEHLREQRTKVRTIVTANYASDVDGLYAAGADFVMMPHLLGGVWITEVLTRKPWTAATFAALKRDQAAELQLRHTAATSS